MKHFIGGAIIGLLIAIRNMPQGDKYSWQTKLLAMAFMALSLGTLTWCFWP